MNLDLLFLNNRMNVNMAIFQFDNLVERMEKKNPNNELIEQFKQQMIDLKNTRDFILSMEQMFVGLSKSNFNLERLNMQLKYENEKLKNQNNQLIQHVEL
jgi:predicted RNase H-like nuclease (RuvC/YqgF family)